jgi:O-antigen/teichoic acid export membrane protein
MFNFAGWNMIGATSAVCRDHGGNIVINLFCGTAVNGARAIAVQVSTIVQNFVSNFQTAINPQIIKSYASGDTNYMMDLVFRGARFSYYILFVLVLPILINTDFILDLWLKEVPPHTSNFLRLVLLFSLAESLSGPLMTAMYATEKIRNYQIVVGFIQFINLPISYLFLYWGYSSESVFIIAIILSLVALAVRLVMLKPLVSLSITAFFVKVLINVSFVTLLSCALPLMLFYYIEPSWFQFLITSLASLIGSALFILFVGCSEKERAPIYNYARRMVSICKSFCLYEK